MLTLLVQELARAKPCLVPVDRLDALLPGADPAELIKAVRVGIEAHAISAWEDAEGGPCLLISSSTQEALDLELLDEDGPWRWIPRHPPKPIKTRKPQPDGEAIDLDKLPDRRGTDVWAIEFLEEAQRPSQRRHTGDYGQQRPRDKDSVDRVDHLCDRHPGRLDWPPDLEVKDKPSCHCCGSGRDVDPSKHSWAFCLACCRSSLDGYLPRAKVKQSRRRYAPTQGKLKGGKG